MRKLAFVVYIFLILAALTFFYYAMPKSSSLNAADSQWADASALVYEEDNRVGRPLAHLKPDFLSMFMQGRIGNNMFQFASLLGLAQMNLKVPLAQYDFALHKIFELKSVVPVKAVPLTNVPFQSIDITSDWGTYVANMSSLGPGSFHLTGYFQSFRYFDSVADLVRENFRFRKHLRIRANLQWDSLIRGIPAAQRQTVVGLHVRRGDMVDRYHRIYGYTTVSCAYVTKAVDFFTRKYNATKTLFLACSDDLMWLQKCLDKEAWASGHRDGQQPTVVFCPEDNDGVADLALLGTFAKHMIMTTGTFSWWAAWLANGTTVYYGHWPRPGSTLSNGFLAKDFFLPNWIPMS